MMDLVTLVIPTYNRPELLERILNYYKNNHVDFKIIVADSSKINIKKLNKKVVKAFPSLNILYLDKFSPDLVSHHKFGRMVEFVKTKYVCFCADDDFIIPSGIKEAVKFLEKNPDYAAAHGTYIHFYLLRGLFGVKEFLWNFRYPYESITSSNSLARFTQHLSKYYQVLWAVRRTSVVKLSYNEFIKSGANPWLFGELLPDMLTLIFGKMKRLNNFYCAREAFSTSYSHWPSLMDGINSGIYNEGYVRYKDCLISNLIKNVSTPQKDLSDIIDVNMKSHLNSSWQEHLTGRINLMLNRFPILFKIIRFLHIKYLFAKPKIDRVGLIDKPSSKYFGAFALIKQTVLQYA